MQRPRAHRWIATWLTAFAVLLVSLAPTRLHAWPGKAAGAWLEVCTASASRTANAAAGDAARGKAAPQPGQAQVFEHCAYCLQQVTTLGLPQAIVVVGLPALGFEVARLRLGAARRAFHGWPSALPRAPPQHA